MYAVDTNVLMRYVLKDDLRQYATVIRLFAQQQQQRTTLYVSCTVCTELEFLLRKGKLDAQGRTLIKPKTKKQVVTVLHALLEKDFLRFDVSSATAILVFASRAADFSDIMIGELGRLQECKTLSFDKKSCRQLTSFVALT